MLTCLYSSRVIIPSLSVSCMLNKTADTAQRQYYQPWLRQSMWACDLIKDTHLSFSFLTLSRWSSVMCSDGGLKWDMTTRNSSKPISSALPSPFWWKFLKEGGANSENTAFVKNQNPRQPSNRHSRTFCRRRPRWSLSGWDCKLDLG